MSVVASIADTITVLQRGATLAEGPYAEVSKNPAVIEAYMGSAQTELAGSALTMAGAFLESATCTPGTASRTCCTASTSTCDEGEVVTLLGRNGAGRTTTLRAILGLIGSAQGLDQGAAAARPIAPADAPHRAPRPRLLPRGARHLLEPVGRGEPDAAAAARRGGMSVDEIYAMFPNLKERAHEPGHAPVRRRAADARGGAHPAHRRAPAAARRDLRRPGAGDRAEARPR